jgi:uncharacterized protein YdeI (YjbR/CyaY-like superfamily)
MIAAEEQNMPRDPRIDAYIAKQAEFARPILEHLRMAVHAASPEIEEAIKWGMPHFVYKGKQLANMAAFKAHATFGFWKGAIVAGDLAKDGGMGQFGRLTSLADLPDDSTLATLVRRAMELTDQGVKRVRKAAAPRTPAEPPEDFRTALDANPAAARIFDGFAPSAKRDYVEWVTGAKRPATRASRIAQSVEWIAEGKKRNWKYEKC